MSARPPPAPGTHAFCWSMMLTLRGSGWCGPPSHWSGWSTRSTPLVRGHCSAGLGGRATGTLVCTTQGIRNWHQHEHYCQLCAALVVQIGLSPGDDARTVELPLGLGFFRSACILSHARLCHAHRATQHRCNAHTHKRTHAHTFCVRPLALQGLAWRRLLMPSTRCRERSWTPPWTSSCSTSCSTARCVCVCMCNTRACVCV